MVFGYVVRLLYHKKRGYHFLLQKYEDSSLNVLDKKVEKNTIEDWELE